MKIEKTFPVEPGQSFTVERFRPDDAPGVANLFLSVYGPNYPVDVYYDPERLLKANQAGDIHFVVCRTPSGDVIAAASLYRSSPPNKNLTEMGLYMVLGSYRQTSAAYRMTRFLSDTLVPELGIEGFYGEVVTNHTATQKVMRLVGAKATGVELLLMPAAIYELEKSASGRVSCIAAFRIERDCPQKIFVPEGYQPLLTNLAARLNMRRELISAPKHSVTESPSRIASQFFNSARVVRTTMHAMGPDLAEKIDGCETDADQCGTVVRQWFLSLSDPTIEGAIALLRSRGYFFGSYLPRWFGGDGGGDGLLMQKVLEEPNYEAIQIHSSETAQILDFIREDRTKAQAAQQLSSAPNSLLPSRSLSSRD